MDDPHPPLLAWYVAGSLDPRQAEEVRAHLEECASCRDEAFKLASLRAALDPAQGHVTAEDLADYAEGLERLAVRKQARIADHLNECAGCRDDLRTLQGDGEPIRPPWRRRRGVLLAASAVVVVALGLLAVRPWGPLPPPHVVEPLATATFAPAQRGTSSPPQDELRGSGPWAVRVLLPSTAPAGAYHATVEDAEGRGILPSGETSDASDGELLLLLPSLGEMKRYRLILRSVAQAEVEFVYPFELADG